MSRLIVGAVALLLAGCSTVAPSVVVSPSVSTTAPTASLPPMAATVPTRDFGPELVLSGGRDRPLPPVMTAAFRPDLVPDHCTDRDLPAPRATDEALLMLDRSYALPAGYEPGDLVAASEAGLAGASGMKLVRKVVVEDLSAMVEAWDEAGLTITIESAYRSYASQAATFDSWLARLPYDEAVSRTARPGHSEHQLGTALDLTSPGWSGRFGDWAAESAEGAWMADHGWEYGFVMSYPEAGREATCFSYEPWHYRWIGRDEAASHRESGLDLRRYLERHVEP